MALPTVVGVGAVSADVGAITPDLPAGIQENDILILFVETANQAVTVSGWTEAPGSPASNATTSTRLSVFWKRAEAAEAAPTTSDSGDHQVGGIMAVRGCVTKGNPFVIGLTLGTSSSSTTKTASSFTTYIDDALVVTAFVQGTDGLTTGQFSSWTNASLANVTERLDGFSDAGDGGGFAVATGEKASAGTVSGTTAVFSAITAGSSWTAAMIPAMYDGAAVVVAKGAVAASGSGASVGVPTGWRRGDLFVMFVETNNETVTVSGWTQAGSSPASNAGTNPTRLTVLYKWAGASESAPTTSDSGDHQIAQMMAVRNARGSGDPFDVTASDAGGNSASVSITGATTTRDNLLVLAGVASTQDGVSNEGVTFSSWANADLSGVVEVLDYANTINAGGAIGVAAGYKTTAGTYGATTVTQTNAVEYATWTGAVLGLHVLAADSGSMTLSGGDVYFGTLFGEDGTLTLAGGDAALAKGIVAPADAGSFALTGNDAAGTLGTPIAAQAGSFAFTGQDAVLEVPAKIKPVTASFSLSGQSAATRRGLKRTAASGAYSLTGSDAELEQTYILFADAGALSLTDSSAKFNQTMKAASGAVKLTQVPAVILAGSPPVNVATFLIELVPDPEAEGGELDIKDYLLRYKEELRVIPDESIWPDLVEVYQVDVKSWSYTEQPTGIGGSLQFELANPADGWMFEGRPTIKFNFFKWDWRGKYWDEYEMLDTGRLRNSSYTIASDGLSPNDTFTVVALTEMEDRLNTAPETNEVWYDPALREVSEEEVPDIEDIYGNVNQSVVDEMPNMTLYDIMERIYVDLCGFDEYITNIPDFRIPLIQFEAGVPYATTLGGVIGIFEPYYSVIPEEGTIRLVVTDGTLTPLPGRVVNLSNSRFMGLDRDGASEGTLNIGAIEVTINNTVPVYMWLDRRSEVTTETTGNFGRDIDEYIERETTTDYIDLYDSRISSTRPFRSYIDKVTVETYRNGKSSGDLVERTVEELTWQLGNLTDRFKTVEVLAPDIVDGEVTGSSLQLVSEEYEDFTTTLDYRNLSSRFVDTKTTVQWGLVYVDTVNQQLDEDYVRDAVSVIRAGNLRADMTPDYRKIKLTRETQFPQRDSTVTVRKLEFDFLANLSSFEEFRQDVGDVAFNTYTDRPTRLLVTRSQTIPGDEGVQIGGRIIKINAGDLPPDLAVAVTRRKLALAAVGNRIFEAEMMKVDPYLRQGTVFSATGRPSPAEGSPIPPEIPLSNYIIEGKTITAGPNGYRMTLSMRSI